MANYLIDGYNLLFACDKQYGQRDPLVHYLKELAKRSGDHLTIVFDAPNEPSMWVRRAKKGPVEVLYSREGQSADACIIELLEKPSIKQWIIVSADREICIAAKLKGAKTLLPSSFLDQIEEKAYRRIAKQEKPLSPSKNEIDTYLEIFSGTPTKKAPAKKSSATPSQKTDPEFKRWMKLFLQRLSGEDSKG